VWDVIDLEVVFVHPRDAGDSRLTYWTYISYALGSLTLLSSLLVGIQVWGLPALGLWGLPVGLGYLVHAFGLPQRSPVIHVAGLGWYLLAFLFAMLTVSPLAILGTGAGLYLGWAGTEGLRHPEDVLGDLPQVTDAEGTSGPIGGLLGGGIVAGIVLGAGLGLIGAAVFAWISVETRSVYGLLLLVPPLAAGYGVALGIGEAAGKVKGLVAAGVATVSILLAFRLLTSLMPQRYQLEPEPLLAIVPLVGIYAAYKLAASHQPTTADESQPDHSTVESSTSSPGTERS
jgi:hypothetical protein